MANRPHFSRRPLLKLAAAITLASLSFTVLAADPEAIIRAAPGACVPCGRR